MNIKVDEDLPNSVVNLLLDQGHAAVSVRAQSMNGWKDDRLWSAVQLEGRYLITADKGFSNIRRYPPGSHNGVVLLRPDRDGIRPLLELLSAVLDRVDLEQLRGAVAVATPRGLRVRHGEG
jgi:predicted nuclease of predicted toxin-antitoxin system